MPTTNPTPIPADRLDDPQYLADVQAVGLMLAERLYDFENGSALGHAAVAIVTSGWLARRDERMRAAGRTAAAADTEHLRAELEDQRGARRVAAESADRFRDVLCEVLGYPDINPGDDVLVAEIRSRHGKTGAEPTRWRDAMVGYEAIRDQINADAAARIAENGADHAND